MNPRNCAAGVGSDYRESAPDVMTVDQGAVFLQIHRDTLYDAIGRGEVPHRRIGRTIRLSREALVRWLEGSCEAASTARK